MLWDGVSKYRLEFLAGYLLVEVVLVPFDMWGILINFSRSGNIKLKIKNVQLLVAFLIFNLVLFNS